MLEQRFRWKNKQIREQISVLDGKVSPSILLKNARFLHSTLHEWVVANIWILQDRIVYVGKEIPEQLKDCEVVDCSEWTLVPGYIEPHVHPSQLYNPHTLSRFAAQTGTTTLINDNLLFFLHLSKKKAFSLMDQLNESPITMYWWGRYDAQTAMGEEERIFTNREVKAWLEHKAVVQGGELTGWPKLLDGDDLMLYWIQETKRLGKKVEGHFPGASEKTLAKMKLFGVDGDHEAMTGEEIYDRLLHGYAVSLRHSSIRPDLPVLLQDMKRLGLTQYNSFMMTTDGSTPAFYKQGMADYLIRLAIENDVPVIDAYHMVSYNIARYFNLASEHGQIATGRVANINFLANEHDPSPHSVLAKGQWVRKEGKEIPFDDHIHWSLYDLDPLQLDWDLKRDDLQFSMPFGIEMVNDVITKPYTTRIDLAIDPLPENQDESYLMLVDRKGNWRINTMIKGFAKSLSGFVSSFSSTGDIIVMGQRKEDMLLAFQRMKEIGGGIVLAEEGNIIFEMKLALAGLMSDLRLEDLAQETETLKDLLVKRGYPFTDPIYSLLFFSATHLPYIRVTQSGLYDVMNKKVLFPTLMR